MCVSVPICDQVHVLARVCIAWKNVSLRACAQNGDCSLKCVGTCSTAASLQMLPLARCALQPHQGEVAHRWEQPADALIGRALGWHSRGGFLALGAAPRRPDHGAADGRTGASSQGGSADGSLRGGGDGLVQAASLDEMDTMIANLRVALPEYYWARENETLARLARRFGRDVDKLLELNSARPPNTR